MKQKIYLLGILVCAALLGTVYYFQYVKGIQPCPLCMMQRLAFYLLGLTCLLAALRKTWRNVCNILLVIFSLFGLMLVGRQVWLQHLPAGQAPACAPGLNFMLYNFPLHETLKVLFYGSGDCAVVHWQFLSLNMAQWSGVFLVGFLVVALGLVWGSMKKG
jgi:disulfide bond formation protein DsbB